MPSKKKAAVLVAVQLPHHSDEECLRSLEELEQLAAGLGFVAVERVVQKRASRSPTNYLGEGKLSELAALIQRSKDSTIVIADDELTPAQQRNLQNYLEVDVLDRTAVILEVFAQRARTRAARLEVELARHEYELPRVRDDHSLGDREGGGGRASRGNTNVELAKQRKRDRIAAIREELSALAKQEASSRRGRAEIFRVALVGYTNAGKSSWMRLLTGSEVHIEDRLFATLGTTVRQLAPPATPPVLVADTVGFIHRLPHALVASFRSTLGEALEAGLLMVVADAADRAFRAQLEVTRAALEEIGAGKIPSILLLNKVDRLTAEERAELQTADPEALLLSALDPRDGRTLHRKIVEFFDRYLVEKRLSIPYARQGIFQEMRDRIRVVEEIYGELLEVTVRATPEILAQLTHHLEKS